MDNNRSFRDHLRYAPKSLFTAFPILWRLPGSFARYIYTHYTTQQPTHRMHFIQFVTQCVESSVYQNTSKSRERVINSAIKRARSVYNVLHLVSENGDVASLCSQVHTSHDAIQLLVRMASRQHEKHGPPRRKSKPMIESKTQRVYKLFVDFQMIITSGVFESSGLHRDTRINIVDLYQEMKVQKFWESDAIVLPPERNLSMFFFEMQKKNMTID